MDKPDKKDILIPFAERSRPRDFKEFMGQEHLVSENRVISSAIKSGRIFSMILWGDPGTGKTTLARLISESLSMDSHMLSAISAGVSDVRDVIKKGRDNGSRGVQTLLFLDEIHRFNKAQQDAVLGAVENGDIVLIGATTENPSFTVIAPLLSRARVLKLKTLSHEHLLNIFDMAVGKDEILQNGNISFEQGVREHIVSISGGDARRMLNIVETAFYLSRNGHIEKESVTEAVKNSMIYYDRAGDRHYDTISAFIKSMRGSDPNAAVYYLARMILAGEDPLFIARRMVIFASEDIGNASPHAINIAVSTLTAVKNIGMPESDIILSQCAAFLASSPKSNASYEAIKQAKERAGNSNHEIPLHLRNAPTGLMRKMGYGKEYRYPHDFDGSFVNEIYLPEEIKDEVFYKPGMEGSEKAIYERLKRLWPDKY